MTRTQGTPEKTFALGWAALRSPSRAAEESRKPGSLVPALWIYAAFTIAYMVFFWLKPSDFPDRNAPFPREMQGLWFWFRVMLWQPPLEIAWMAFLLGLLEWFREGKLGVRMILGVAWTAFPFILMASYKQMPTWAFAVGSAVWIALFIPMWRRAATADWKPVVVLMLALNAIGLALIAPMTLAVAIDQPGFFTFSQAVGGLWMLVAGALAVRKLTGLRLPRAFMAMLFSMFLQIAFAFTLHLLGLVPSMILKALLYA